MFNRIGAIASGRSVGALARCCYPGAGEMGWLWTIGLALAGSGVNGSAAQGSTGVSTRNYISKRQIQSDDLPA